MADFSAQSLRRLRAQSRMSTRELAVAVGCSKSQIVAYENGHRTPDPPRIRRIAEALSTHPAALMDRESWLDAGLADLRRACGLRAQDAYDALGVAPKTYRRFEQEGIVPARRPRFLDDVADLFGIHRRHLERAIDNMPPTRVRHQRAAGLLEILAQRYVRRPGTWRGPDPEDRELTEMAILYGRSIQRTRRVLTHELGSLRLSMLRGERERIIAEFDLDAERQKQARAAHLGWNRVYQRELALIPMRLESFHRTAQPSETWQAMVDMFEGGARALDGEQRGDNTWMLAGLPPSDSLVASMPPWLVARKYIDGIPVCRLTFQGQRHVQEFEGLYASLFPMIRRLRRAEVLATGRRRRRAPVAEAVSLPGNPERLVPPASAYERYNQTAYAQGRPVHVPLSATATVIVDEGAWEISASR